MTLEEFLAVMAQFRGWAGDRPRPASAWYLALEEWAEDGFREAKKAEKLAYESKNVKG